MIGFGRSKGGGRKWAKPLVLAALRAALLGCSLWVMHTPKAVCILSKSDNDGQKAATGRAYQS